MNATSIRGCAIWLAVLASGALGAAQPERELRVCADPDNLPFSNRAGEGFENRIADVVAADLGASVRYTWHPQRKGFVRQTLKAGTCDLVIGVPAGYDPMLTTRPYYSSTYVFVYGKDRNLNLHTFDDPPLRTLRIGLHAFGDDGANSPAAHALAQRGIVGNVVGFTILDTNDSPSGRIIDAVARGEIDVAIVWGPFAGYFAQHQSVPLALVPVAANASPSPMPFVYDIAMGVRRGDVAFKDEIETTLARRHSEISKVLDDFQVPRVLSIRPSVLR
jgi:quinoprotein dehydrogenase-associated probable ABC transporter substrate-binding protein